MAPAARDRSPAPAAAATPRLVPSDRRHLMGSPIRWGVPHSHAGPEPTSSWVNPPNATSRAAPPPYAGQSACRGAAARDCSPAPATAATPRLVPSDRRHLMGSPIRWWVLHSHAGPEPTSSWVNPPNAALLLDVGDTRAHWLQSAPPGAPRAPAESSPDADCADRAAGNRLPATQRPQSTAHSPQSTRWLRSRYSTRWLRSRRPRHYPGNAVSPKPRGTTLHRSPTATIVRARWLHSTYRTKQSHLDCADHAAGKRCTTTRRQQSRAHSPHSPATLVRRHHPAERSIRLTAEPAVTRISTAPPTAHTPSRTATIWWADPACCGWAHGMRLAHPHAGGLAHQMGPAGCREVARPGWSGGGFGERGGGSRSRRRWRGGSRPRRRGCGGEAAGGMNAARMGEVVGGTAAVPGCAGWSGERPQRGCVGWSVERPGGVETWLGVRTGNALCQPTGSCSRPRELAGRREGAVAVVGV